MISGQYDFRETPTKIGSDYPDSWVSKTGNILLAAYIEYENKPNGNTAGTYVYFWAIFVPLNLQPLLLAALMWY